MKLTRSILLAVLTCAGLVLLAYRPRPDTEPSARVSEPAPYDTAQALEHPPPYESIWQAEHNPAQCGSCHARIFEEWNGSMMANSWRDPAWRAAFLLIARITATDGDCDVPDPPDGTERAQLNPFAAAHCSSVFETDEGTMRTQHSGSLLDGFCSRCHMPTNYADNIPLRNVEVDPVSGVEHGRLDPTFDPTSDHGSGVAFATVDAYLRNTTTGKRGIFCSICHTMGASRNTPFHNLPAAGGELMAASQHEVPAPDQLNLGYAVGAGSFRLSPDAIVSGDVFGPLLAAGEAPMDDPYLSSVFGEPITTEPGAFSSHGGMRHVKFERAEMCAACHDVTNPLTVRNPLGRWVGGFPIERTYTEWANSRYADRPGNESFDPRFKRDCQTCHMQQHFGQPGTAQTLYDKDGEPLPPLASAVATDGPEREPYFSHHFIGGNALVPRMIGADVTPSGAVASYPELSVFSYSSADKKSLYANAYWTNTDASGPPTHHARMAWDRLRNVVSLDLETPARAAAGEQVPVRIRVANSGSGHNFPTGFPEGRVAWVALRAYDLATGEELEIYDGHWNHQTRGVGYLTTEDVYDPNFPGCDWSLPAGSPDPYAHQMKAVASLGDGCPTLDLVYASPLNISLDAQGRPVDTEGRPVGREHPDRLPHFRDLDGDGDHFDDSFVVDTRLRPLPHDDAMIELDRYRVVLPPETVGPVAVVAAVYYQSLEAMVAKKFLGNLADTDTDLRLEPCALGGPCDGRSSRVEPPVVEGSPPVPMEVTVATIWVEGGSLPSPSALAASHASPAPRSSAFVARPRVRTYPQRDAARVYRDVVIKASFSVPVTGIDAESFVLEDANGLRVAAAVDQIGDSTWGLFPDRIFLEPGERYTARLRETICAAAGSCIEPTSWQFRVHGVNEDGDGDSGIPIGFAVAPREDRSAPAVRHAQVAGDRELVITFTRPVMNVSPRTVMVRAAASVAKDGSCVPAGAPIAGRLASDAAGADWHFTAYGALPEPAACVTVTGEVYGLNGVHLGRSFIGVAASVDDAR